MAGVDDAPAETGGQIGHGEHQCAVGGRASAPLGESLGGNLPADGLR